MPSWDFVKIELVSPLLPDGTKALTELKFSYHQYGDSNDLVAFGNFAFKITATSPSGQRIKTGQRVLP